MPWLPKPRDNRSKAEKNKSWGGDTSFYRTAPWRKLRKLVLDKNSVVQANYMTELLNILKNIKDKKHLL